MLVHCPQLLVLQGGDMIQGEQDQDTAESSCLELNSNHGKNIELSNHNLTAMRVSSYNQGVIVSHKPLQRNKVFRVGDLSDRLS